MPNINCDLVAGSKLIHFPRHYDDGMHMAWCGFAAEWFGYFSRNIKNLTCLDCLDRINRLSDAAFFRRLDLLNERAKEDEANYRRE